MPCPAGSRWLQAAGAAWPAQRTPGSPFRAASAPRSETFPCAAPEGWADSAEGASAGARSSGGRGLREAWAPWPREPDRTLEMHSTLWRWGQNLNVNSPPGRGDRTLGVNKSWGEREGRGERLRMVVLDSEEQNAVRGAYRTAAEQLRVRNFSPRRWGGKRSVNSPGTPLGGGATARGAGLFSPRSRLGLDHEPRQKVPRDAAATTSPAFDLASAATAGIGGRHLGGGSLRRAQGSLRDPRPASPATERSQEPRSGPGGVSGRPAGETEVRSLLRVPARSDSWLCLSFPSQETPVQSP